MLEEIVECKIIKPQKGQKAKLVEMATNNAKEALEKKTNELLFKPKKYEDSNIEENSSKKRTGILGNGYVYRINQYGIDKEIKK